MILVTGAKGLLGKALMTQLGRRGIPAHFRLESPPNYLSEGLEGLILAAGTKGFAACEGNSAAFRADVDGNIHLGRLASKSGIFTVFVSTDAVECAMNGAYARNRFLVELALGGLPHVGIFRPGKFDESNVFEVAKACLNVLNHRLGGVNRWPG